MKDPVTDSESDGASPCALELAFSSTYLDHPNFQAPNKKNCRPIYTLPAEITAGIFVHFLPDYPEHPPMTGLFSPTLLGQICRNWREIAFDTPRLWRAICIYLSGAGIDVRLKLLTTWLSRSKSCAFSLSFKVKYTLNLP
ncbi:hypothetical protein C8J57DRAFT_1151499, partial [Mycena rebaudengoi]